jgi:hypothetical protein
MGRARASQTKSNPNPTPPRKPARFREAELARAVRAAKEAGGERVEVDPASGKITVVLGKVAERDEADITGSRSPIA